MDAHALLRLSRHLLLLHQPLQGGWSRPCIALSKHVCCQSVSSLVHTCHHSTNAQPGDNIKSPSRSSQHGPAPDIKTALRRLYKRVHPDLFSDDHTAKAENERSFKLLQEYLQLAREGGRDMPSARVMYRFCFYIREEQDPQHAQTQEQTRETTGTTDSSRSVSQDVQQQDAAGGRQDTHTATAAVNGSGKGGGGGGGDGEDNQDGSSDGKATPASRLRKVEISLPPPVRPTYQNNTNTSTSTAGSSSSSTSDTSGPKGNGGRDHQEGGDKEQGQPRLATSVRKGLARLFNVCGIQVESHLGQSPSTGEGGIDTEEWEAGDPTQLSSFLPQAMEAQRIAQISNLEPSIRVANMRGAFRLQRKLLVSFQNARHISASQQVAHLTQLAAVLDKLPQLNLEGASIVMGDTLGVDKLGNLCLDIRSGGGGGSSWAELLSGVDLDFVRQRKAYVHAVKELEKRVASAVGLNSVFASLPHVTAEPTYRSFLERLAHAGTSLGQVADGNFKDVPLCVLPTYAFHLQNQHQHPQPPPLGPSSYTHHQSTTHHDPPHTSSTPPARISQVDLVQGVLCIPDELTAGQVYGEVMRQGPIVQQCIRANKSRHQSLQDLSKRVRQALHLRHFTRDDNLADSHYQAACHRLLTEADALAYITDGGSIRIGFKNRVWPDGTCVEIAHDFKF